MTFSIFTAIIPTIAYATISLYAIHAPAMALQTKQVEAAPIVLTQEIKLTATPAPTATPTAIPTPVVASIATPVTPVASEANAAPATTVLSDAQITFLGTCESGMRPETNTGNGYFGAFQFSIATWNAMGTGFERADLAPLDVQINAVQKLLSRSSIFTQFPGCANKMRNAGLI